MNVVIAAAEGISRRAFFRRFARAGVALGLSTGTAAGLLSVLTRPLVARADPCSCGNYCITPCTCIPPGYGICCQWNDCSCTQWYCCCPNNGSSTICVYAYNPGPPNAVCYCYYC